MDSLTSQAAAGHTLNRDTVKSEALRNIISPRNINRVVPIISNSFWLEQILRHEKKITDLIPRKAEDIDEDLSIEEQLTRIWAREIKYPMTDDHNLARVAQYYQVQKNGSDVAKEDYLEFLNSYLLKINANEDKNKQVVEELAPDTRMLSFAEIALKLGYAQATPGDDPLGILARVPFPVYITTSYYDALERALKLAGREPRIQVILWEEGREFEDVLEKRHSVISGIKPTAAEPVVYHLFGLENYPGSLVISEDDYMKFLVSVVSDTDTQNPIVPLKLREVLASSHLLMLGYHLRDWDFRVLFRYILNLRKGRSPKQGIFIQSEPKKDNRNLLDYLRRFFNMEQFEIEWKSPSEFTHELWDIWKGWQPHE